MKQKMYSVMSYDEIHNKVFNFKIPMFWAENWVIENKQPDDFYTNLDEWEINYSYDDSFKMFKDACVSGQIKGIKYL